MCSFSIQGSVLITHWSGIFFKKKAFNICCSDMVVLMLTLDRCSAEYQFIYIAIVLQFHQYCLITASQTLYHKNIHALILFNVTHLDTKLRVFERDWFHFFWYWLGEWMYVLMILIFLCIGMVNYADK